MNTKDVLSCSKLIEKREILVSEIQILKQKAEEAFDSEDLFNIEIKIFQKDVKDEKVKCANDNPLQTFFGMVKNNFGRNLHETELSQVSTCVLLTLIIQFKEIEIKKIDTELSTFGIKI
jgi:hypothetical protein